MKIVDSTIQMQGYGSHEESNATATTTQNAQVQLSGQDAAQVQLGTSASVAVEISSEAHMAFAADTLAVGDDKVSHDSRIREASTGTHEQLSRQTVSSFGSASAATSSEVSATTATAGPMNISTLSGQDLRMTILMKMLEGMSKMPMFAASGPKATQAGVALKKMLENLQSIYGQGAQTAGILSNTRQTIQASFSLNTLQSGALSNPQPVAQQVRPVSLNISNTRAVTVQTSSDTMQFAATGSVKTTDGQQIDLDLMLSLSRQSSTTTTEESSSIQKTPQMKDPLVVNFDAVSAKLTQQKFDFDIDADGQSERISSPGQGSGFLAVDWNEDGQINDGSELFGAKSGDGFADLAQYDQDHNGWIDENDAIFAKLKIWAKGSDGQDQLFSLADKGIGAIYLGNVNTSYLLQNDANEQQGKIAQTGVFLRENGTAGTIQHVDLVV